MYLACVLPPQGRQSKIATNSMFYRSDRRVGSNLKSRFGTRGLLCRAKVSQQLRSGKANVVLDTRGFPPAEQI